MNELIKTLLGRIVGAGIGAIVGLGASKGVQAISPEAAADLTRALTDGAMLAGYGIAHKLTNRTVNPADSAKS